VDGEYKEIPGAISKVTTSQLVYAFTEPTDYRFAGDLYATVYIQSDAYTSGTYERPFFARQPALGFARASPLEY